MLLSQASATAQAQVHQVQRDTGAALTTSMLGALLLHALDEIDYGVVVLNASGRVNVANRAARLECGANQDLLLLDGAVLRAQRPADAAALHRALQGAVDGRRTLLRLGDGEQAISIAVVPLPHQDAGSSDARVLLMFGKRRVCESLSVEFFARTHHLTNSETQVLVALCHGERPSAMATRLGVALSTVRTHVASIRMKTAAASIRDLVGQVAVLPPIVPALRNALVH